MKHEILDPNEAFILEALQLITNVESKDKTLAPVDSSSPAIDEIIIYLRAKYITIDNAVVIKTTQDVSITPKERFVIYFFIAPEPGQDYIVYRAIVDYD